MRTDLVVDEDNSSAWGVNFSHKYFCLQKNLNAHHLGLSKNIRQLKTDYSRWPLVWKEGGREGRREAIA